MRVPDDAQLDIPRTGCLTLDRAGMLSELVQGGPAHQLTPRADAAHLADSEVPVDQAVQGSFLPGVLTVTQPLFDVVHDPGNLFGICLPGNFPL